MAVIDTVLLKVASRCNLNCTYCYVYNMGDDGWRSQPKQMSDGVQRAIVDQLAALSRAQVRPFSIVLHGGEPLLLGAYRLAALFSALRGALSPRYGVHLQTNGLLLSDQILDLCAEFKVGISISLDGTPELNDRNRVGHDGKGSHSRIMEALRRLQSHMVVKELFSGVLAVIDPTSDPAELYAFFKAIGTPSIDFLYRDGNHNKLPYGKSSFASDEYGRWMSRLLDLYLGDPMPPRIRVLDDMLKLLLGGSAKKEGVGISDFGIVVIDTDGSIRKNDTQKSVGNFSDHFQSNWSVLTHRLHEIVKILCCAAAKFCHLQELSGAGGLWRWDAAASLERPQRFRQSLRLLSGPTCADRADAAVDKGYPDSRSRLKVIRRGPFFSLFSIG